MKGKILCFVVVVVNKDEGSVGSQVKNCRNFSLASRVSEVKGILWSNLPLEREWWANLVVCFAKRKRIWNSLWFYLFNRIIGVRMLYVPLQLKKLLKTLILFKQSKSYTLRVKTAGKHEWARKANQTTLHL